MDLTTLEAAIAAAKEREQAREQARRDELAEGFRELVVDAFGLTAWIMLDMHTEVVIPESIAAVFAIGDATYRLSGGGGGIWTLAIEVLEGAYTIHRQVQFLAATPVDIINKDNRLLNNSDRLLLAIDHLRTPVEDDRPL